MRDRGVRALVVAWACGLALVVVGGLLTTASGAPAGPTTDRLEAIGRLDPGSTACEGPIALDDDVTRLAIGVQSADDRPTPVRVGLRDHATGARLSEGTSTAAPGRGAPARVEAAIPAAGSGTFVDACVKNVGPRPVVLRGEPGTIRLASAGRPVVEVPGYTPGSPRIDGRPLAGDLHVAFPTRRSSVLGRAPLVVERMARFHGGFGLGGWPGWILLGGMIFAGPLLLGFALRRALEGDAEDAL